MYTVVAFIIFPPWFTFLNCDVFKIKTDTLIQSMYIYTFINITAQIIQLEFLTYVVYINYHSFRYKIQDYL